MRYKRKQSFALKLAKRFPHGNAARPVLMSECFLANRSPGRQAAFKNGLSKPRSDRVPEWLAVSVQGRAARAETSDAHVGAGRSLLVTAHSAQSLDANRRETEKLDPVVHSDRSNGIQSCHAKRLRTRGAFTAAEIGYDVFTGGTEPVF